MRRITVFAGILLLTGCISLPTRGPARAPQGWVAIAPAKFETDAGKCEYWAGNKWRVSLSSDSTDLILFRGPDWSPRSSMRVSGGELLGLDGGEFGGGIFWHADSGVRDTLANDNLFAFVNVSGRVIALVGLAHLTSDYGKALELDTVAGRWRATQLADLGSVPTAYSRLSADSLLIATSRNVQMFRPGEEPGVLYQADVHPYLRATSIVRDRAGIVYMSAGRLIIRLTPGRAAFQEDWLVPANCRRMARVPRTMIKCVCVAETPSAG